MKSLYIIGNGFDRAHNLDTSYWSFREYLDDKYPDFLVAFEHLYNIGRIDFQIPELEKVHMSVGKSYSRYIMGGI